jgi:hypothetical protein
VPCCDRLTRTADFRIVCSDEADPDLLRHATALAEVFENTPAAGTDLLLTRPSAAEDTRMFESDRAVWRLPFGAAHGLRRAMVRVGLGTAGSWLLREAALIAGTAGAEELVVAHVFSQNTLDQDADSLAELREARMLDLYRLLARTDLCGVLCTPVVEESLRPVDATLRLTARCEPDLVIDSLSWPGIYSEWSRREAARYLRELDTPILNLPAPVPRPHWARILASRVFQESEPQAG